MLIGALFSHAFTDITICNRIYLTPLSLSSFCGTETNSADPDQTPQVAVSDLGMHCLVSINKKYNRTTLKWEIPLCLDGLILTGIASPEICLAISFRARLILGRVQPTGVKIVLSGKPMKEI